MNMRPRSVLTSLRPRPTRGARSWSGVLACLALACGDSAETSTMMGPSTNLEDGGATTGDAGAGSGAQTPFAVEIAGQRVSGFVQGGGFTIVAPPRAFQAPLFVWAVQRGTEILADEDAVRRSCARPLDAVDGLTPPIYALRAVLINPLAGAPLLAAIRDRGETSVTHVRNPLVLERLEFDEPSIQDGVPRGVLGTSDLRSSDFPRGQYGWALLCAGLANPQVSVRARIAGTMAGVPYDGTIAHAPWRVEAAR